MSFHNKKTRFTSKGARESLQAKFSESIAVTDIAELVAREKAWDDMCELHCAEVKSKHINSHMDDYLPVVYDINSTEFCDECETPKFPSYDKKHMKRVMACFGCIEALRLQSIEHETQDTDICLACEIIYDDYGFISGVLHQSRTINDDETMDGTLIKGLKTLVSEGKVTRYDNDSEDLDIIFLDGEPVYF
mgnify:FL=1